MINFSKVKNSVRELKKQLAAGQIDEQSFEDQLLEMIDVAEDGYYWMFGHESEIWFRHDGEKWVPDDPDRISVLREKTSIPKDEDSNSESGSISENFSVNPGWLIASIIFITAIGWIVYNSSLG